MTLVLFNGLAFAATLAGGLAPGARGLLSKSGMWRIFALRAGILLSVAFTEVLPAAWRAEASLAGWGSLAAFAFLVFVGSLTMVDTCPEYLEECPVHLLGWTALAALFAHAFLDGFNLAVSFSAAGTAGVGVGLALTLHHLADGFTLTTFFRQAGYSGRRSAAALAVVAAATPLGSLLHAAGAPGLPGGAAAALLGFAGGCFIYIGAADMLPRLHRAGDRASLASFAAGLVGFALLGRLAG